VCAVCMQERSGICGATRVLYMCGFQRSTYPTRKSQEWSGSYGVGTIVRYTSRLGSYTAATVRYQCTGKSSLRRRQVRGSHVSERRGVKNAGLKPALPRFPNRFVFFPTPKLINAESTHTPPYPNKHPTYQRHDSNHDHHRAE
jgi:hypothetical protein